MEVTVTKFERHLEMSKVSVTFLIKKSNSNFATTMASLIDMSGTDDEMVTVAWENLQEDVKYWVSTTEKNVVGQTFSVPIPQAPVTQTVEVPTQETTSTEEASSNSGDQVHTE